MQRWMRLLVLVVGAGVGLVLAIASPVNAVGAATLMVLGAAGAHKIYTHPE